MILWVALLMSHCCRSLNAAEQGSKAGLERIEHCGTRCSQGLRCKTKPHSLFPPPCQNPAEGLNTSSVFHNISLSTVMRCEGRQKCSLHLRIKTELQLTEAIHGVSICAVTAGMMGNCRNLSFTRTSRERMFGMQVEIENDCTDISASQHVEVMVKTVPNYCGIMWTGAYEAPGCISKDLQRHVPECNTGRLSYDVNSERKELNVTVSDMLEDHDYHLRLCRNDFICIGTGAHVLIKKEEPVKSAILLYSRPLPCLCIEGWSAVTDAPRVQVCPFKERIEELWSGISFVPLEGTLSWEPACWVAAEVSLCQRREDGVCVDLPHASQKASREKIIFTEVDPHPQLCMKFTADSQSWTRCPFDGARFQAWEVVVTRSQGYEDVKMLSQITATFSVGLCVKSEGSSGCQTTKTHAVHAEKQKAVGLNMAGHLCNCCVQVTRTDVKFAATIIHCLGQCNKSSLLRPVVSSQASWDLTWLFVPAGVFLCGITAGSLVLFLLFAVYQRRKQKRKGSLTSEKQTDPAFDCSVPVLQIKPILHGEVLIPDSKQCENAEKANLISY